MTFEELRNFIHDHYISSLSYEEINNHINEAYKDLTRVFTPDFPETETVSATPNQETVTMTNNARAVRMVFISEPQEGLHVKVVFGHDIHESPPEL